MADDDLDLAVERAVRAIEHAAEQLDVAPSTATRGVRGTGPAMETIDAAERALSGLPDDPSRRDAILRLRTARAEMLAAQLARQRSAMTLVMHQIARIRAARTVDDLVESVPLETSALGYERAMFSWVRDECWVPRSSHTVGGPRESQAMLAAGGPPYQPVRKLHEVEVVRQRKPILVLDALSDPRVHPTIMPVTRSVTYVAAPVVVRDRVAAMIHADRNVDTGLNDEFDRDLLALFSQTVGIALEHLLDTPATTPTSTTAVIAEEWWDALTERERDVLRLVATGLTNADIGARLYISEETTKTHVKKLMRKMGVANRSHAGAMYHQLHSRSA
ncbi:LuxR family transcriptional regulator [Gordonia sp. zg691]|uniref:helix-turn-helix transcriptional regulator n=1 Tax=Gordonia jinghuaiqii TaxID=2758710 RepID=UPI0016622975|nr:LuxR C-terminal-related transcriptional regulator [Gordonia jinghuaiqii]MBD0860349.1 LuxR family transcriptional regulator [Gordonia jinghuaiqii]